MRHPLGETLGCAARAPLRRTRASGAVQLGGAAYLAPRWAAFATYRKTNEEPKHIRNSVNSGTGLFFDRSFLLFGIPNAHSGYGG